MFSVVLPGRPCLTDMVTISANQFAFNFPSSPHFSHVVVFILPGNVLPPGTAAAVYMQLPGDSTFRFLGAIGNEKPSAIFKVNLPSSTSSNNPLSSPSNNQGLQDEMSDVSFSPPGSGMNLSSSLSPVGDQRNIALGISVEPAENISAQLTQLKNEQQLKHISNGNAMALTTTTSPTSTSSALVKSPPSTKVLAQRIIKNAFNFLASFAGGQGGQEVVPLRSFEDWWRKFERRVENDPGFLERDDP